MGLMQRRKGRSFELEVCTWFREVLGIEAAVRLGQPRDGGCDLDVPALARFKFEAKRRRRIMVERWLEQCEISCQNGHIPVVIMRADQGEPMALLRWTDMLGLLGNELRHNEAA